MTPSKGIREFKRRTRTSTNAHAGRRNAQAEFPLTDLCEECGLVPPVDRHHVDGNPVNNVRENILCVCRRCHMVLDGRLYQRRGKLRSHCKRGHSFTPENTYVNPAGVRSCRTCQRESWRRYDARRRTPLQEGATHE